MLPIVSRCWRSFSSARLASFLVTGSLSAALNILETFPGPAIFCSCATCHLRYTRPSSALPVPRSTSLGEQWHSMVFVLRGAFLKLPPVARHSSQIHGRDLTLFFYPEAKLFRLPPAVMY